MRVSTGVPGLDELIGGGIPENRVYLICGPPGSGKTTFALQFLLEGALNGQRGLFVSMIEVPENIIDDFSSFYPNFKKVVRDDLIRFVDLAPETLLEGGSGRSSKSVSGKSGSRDLVSLLETMDKDYVMLSSELLGKLFEEVRGMGAARLVIDSALPIRFATGDEKLQVKEMIRFVRGLKDVGCTTLLISELIQPDAYSAEHFLAHGVIFLHNFLDKGKMRRAIQIIKLKGAAHDTEMHKIEFTRRGLTVSTLPGIE